VRRCHGDLHLNNIVALDNSPVLFDALEFDEKLATIDILYDLAFLLMDLDSRGLKATVNRVFNRYVVLSNDPACISGIATLPLFLSCRAAIRAMVAITRYRGKADSQTLQEINRYFELAGSYLRKQAPRLICVGGLSGSGKTTVARSLAPHADTAPGALHLRSDVERKLMFGVAETKRLGPAAYSRDVSKRVYQRLVRKAKLALLAGNSVVVDAVFSEFFTREQMEQLGARLGVRFDGIWLTAGEDRLVERVANRRGDASDATVEVVRQQLEKQSEIHGWHLVNSEGSPEDVLEKCREVLQL
jgi:predicted kinase